MTAREACLVSSGHEFRAGFRARPGCASTVFGCWAVRKGARKSAAQVEWGSPLERTGGTVLNEGRSRARAGREERRNTLHGSEQWRGLVQREGGAGDSREERRKKDERGESVSGGPGKGRAPVDPSLVPPSRLPTLAPRLTWVSLLLPLPSPVTPCPPAVRPPPLAVSSTRCTRPLPSQISPAALLRHTSLACRLSERGELCHGLQEWLEPDVKRAQREGDARSRCGRHGRAKRTASADSTAHDHGFGEGTAWG